MMHGKFLQALQHLHSWDQLSLSECEEIAHSLAKLLPSSFQLDRVEHCQVGTQSHYVAFFDWIKPPSLMNSFLSGSYSFALLPGGTVTLGYDRTRGHTTLRPDEDLIRDWQDYNLYGHGDSVLFDGDLIRDVLPANYEAFYEYLDRTLLPMRTVTLPPFLLEVRPIESGEALGARERSILQQELSVLLQQWGFRLPTSDEWEYGCSSGTRTLFYWGNGPFVAGGHTPNPLPIRNAFGLDIANDRAYFWEYCTDPTIMRGGDGGVSNCGGGLGILADRLICSSAYYRRLDEDDIFVGKFYSFFRRVFEIAPLFS